MSISSSAKVTATGARIPRDQLEQLLALAGPDATFTFQQSSPDRPGETTTSTITASWTEPVTIEPAAARDYLTEPEPEQDIEAAITQLAKDLWKADPRKNTPAREFHEDYAAAQDRYFVMARAILAPEPVEPAKK